MRMMMSTKMPTNIMPWLTTTFLTKMNIENIQNNNIK